MTQPDRDINNLITMSCLGKRGRYGNQVFQYAFLRTYAKRYGLDYQCPPWIGQRLFGHEDPPLSEALPTYHERRQQSMNPAGLNECYPPDGDEVRGHDFLGYAQPHTRYYTPDKEFIQGLFQGHPVLETGFDEPLAKLRRRGSTIIGLHMRRGDYGRFIFYLTPNQWYLKWLDENWGRFDNPVLFIASEDPNDADIFDQYPRVTSADLLSLSDEPYGVYNYLQPDMENSTPTKMDWFPDWYFLTQCDVLAIANSTFGFTAAMMAQGIQECWRSRLSTQAFERIDPWDSLPLVREDLRDHPGIPGTWLDDNPNWLGGGVQGKT